MYGVWISVYNSSSLFSFKSTYIYLWVLSCGGRRKFHFKHAWGPMPQGYQRSRGLVKPLGTGAGCLSSLVAAEMPVVGATGVLRLHDLCHTWGGVLISKKRVLLWYVCGHQGPAPPGALHKHCPGPHFLWNPDFLPSSNPGPKLHSFFTLFKGPFPPGQ